MEHRQTHAAQGKPDPERISNQVRGPELLWPERPGRQAQEEPQAASGQRPRLDAVEPETQLTLGDHVGADAHGWDRGGEASSAAGSRFRSSAGRLAASACWLN